MPQQVVPVSGSQKLSETSPSMPTKLGPPSIRSQSSVLSSKPRFSSMDGGGEKDGGKVPEGQRKRARVSFVDRADANQTLKPSFQPPNKNLRRLSMGMGTATGGKAVIAKAPWWHRIVPGWVKTHFLRDIKILHEEDVEDKIFITKSGSHGPRIDPWSFMLHPDSSIRLFWDIVTALFVLVLIWLVPFYIGFETWKSKPMSVLSTIMDVWFIIDVFLNFRTGYVDHGATVMDKKKIAKNYLKTWFIIDFFASIPWEIFIKSDEATSSGSKTQNKATRKSAKMTKYFKIPKLLRMARLLRAFNKYARFYALTLVVLGMVVTLHVGACMIAQALEICVAEFLIFNDETGDYSIESNYEMDVCGGNSVFSLYSEALYVCFTLCIGMSPSGGTLGASQEIKDRSGVSITHALLSYSTGGGDWRVGSTMYFVTVILMLLGIGEMSLVVGHIGLLLRDRHLASAVFRSKLDRVKEELKYYGVPWVLQNRVLAYYDYMWVNQKQYDDKITLLTDKGMSSDLRGKLALHMYKDVVQGVSLFSRVDDTFLSKVCMELQTRVFLPGDWIILKGDIGSELYIISRGVCQVFLKDPWEIEESDDPEDEKEILLSNGQFFGEISLLMEVRRTTSVQAKTICEVNVLVQEIFEEILRESPDFAEEMKMLIVKRKVENFQKLHHEVASLEEREIIEDAVTEAIESRQLSLGGAEHHDYDVEEEDFDEDGYMGNELGLDNLINKAKEGGSSPKTSSTPAQSLSLTTMGVGLVISRSESPRNSGRDSEPRSGRERTSSSGSIGRGRKKSIEMTLGNLDLSAGGLGLAEEMEEMVESACSSGRRGSISTLLNSAALRRVESGKSVQDAADINLSETREKKSGAPRERRTSQVNLTTRPDDIVPDHTALAAGGMRLTINQTIQTRPGLGARQGTRGDFFSTIAAEEFVSNEDVVSQQLGLLQERIDKIYAMLTTKLGRVR